MMALQASIVGVTASDFLPYQGGMIAPTSGEGYMKLEAIRDEFGVNPRQG